MANSIIGLGTEVKINIHIEPISVPTEEDPENKLHMEDYDFNIRFYTRPTKIKTVIKEDMIRKDPDNYVAVVDTNDVGTGMLQMIVTAAIDDGDCADMLRTEVTPSIMTNIQIVK